MTIRAVTRSVQRHKRNQPSDRRSFLLPQRLSLAEVKAVLGHPQVAAVLSEILQQYGSSVGNAVAKATAQAYYNAGIKVAVQREPVDVRVVGMNERVSALVRDAGGQVIGSVQSDVSGPRRRS